MTNTVIKRDGTRDTLNWNRVRQAVLATEHLTSEEADVVTANVKAEFALYTGPISILAIQDAVENVLMEDHPNAARTYIEYRHDRDRARSMQSALTRDIGGLLGLGGSDVSATQNENANKDSRVIPCQRDLLAGMVAKDYARNHMLPKRVVSAHDEGLIHYHDMDYNPLFPMFNCMLVDLNNMLTNGFKMGNAEITSPRSITTATAVTAQIIAQVASHTYGGTTINRIDEVLAPFVMKTWYKHHDEITDDLHAILQDDFSYAEYADAIRERADRRTAKTTYDAFQSLEYEVNTLHTANGQTPFVTFGFGLGECWASKLIQRSILAVRMVGLGKNAKTAVFPKLVFAIKEGLNRKEGQPNYDIKQMALKCATERMYPDILNYDKVVENTGSFKTPMGCRSFLGYYEDENGNEVIDGRNNLGVVSINLPRIALAKHVECDETFYRELDAVLDVAFEALMVRIDRLRGVKASVAPILYCEGALGKRLKPDDDVMQLFENGRASISLGYIGIHEVVNAVFGPGDVVGNEEKEAFAAGVLRHLKVRTEEWTENTGFAFSLYGTPSENLCTRFCELDKKAFGEVEGVTDKGYYTNSFHLDVRKKVTPYEKVQFERPFVDISTGGFICYGEFPNMQHNIKALEDVWDYTYDKVPYYGTNTPIDECYACGYKGEFRCLPKGFTCPSCGCHEPGKVSVTRRVCGYLGSPDARPFNTGKQAEVEKRVKHL